ncbi:hypothetical protein [Paenibacillus sp. 32O-W]|uniref:hypothetical protein n=1 Tax=Paenibacillus sp. 32O-W TaxID=1695218 RepID=UPI0011A5EF81|nr:hypothetical protein [Paenibacillus sp. 32O-W]
MDSKVVLGESSSVVALTTEYRGAVTGSKNDQRSFARSSARQLHLDSVFMGMHRMKKGRAIKAG